MSKWHLKSILIIRTSCATQTFTDVGWKRPLILTGLLGKLRQEEDELSAGHFSVPVGGKVLMDVSPRKLD